jgi:hypothetical protein
LQKVVVAETLPPVAAIRDLNAVEESLPEPPDPARKAVHKPKVALPLAMPATGPVPVGAVVNDVEAVVVVVWSAVVLALVVVIVVAIVALVFVGS